MKKKKILFGLVAGLLSTASAIQAATVYLENKTDRAIRAYVEGTNRSNRESSVKIFPYDFAAFTGKNITGPARFVILDRMDALPDTRLYHRMFIDKIYEIPKSIVSCSGIKTKWIEIHFDEKTKVAEIEEFGELKSRQLKDSDAQIDVTSKIPHGAQRAFNRYYQDKVRW